MHSDSEISATAEPVLLIGPPRDQFDTIQRNLCNRIRKYPVHTTIKVVIHSGLYMCIHFRQLRTLMPDRLQCLKQSEPHPVTPWASPSDTCNEKLHFILRGCVTMAEVEYPMTCRPVARCGGTSATGGMTGRGKRLRKPCGLGFEKCGTGGYPQHGHY